MQMCPPFPSAWV